MPSTISFGLSCWERGHRPPVWKTFLIDCNSPQEPKNAVLMEIAGIMYPFSPFL